MADMTVNNRCGSIADQATRAACEAAPAECNAASSGEPAVYRGTAGQCGRVEELLRQIRSAKDAARKWSQCMMVRPEERMRRLHTPASCAPGTAADEMTLRRELRTLLERMVRVSK